MDPRRYWLFGTNRKFDRDLNRVGWVYIRSVVHDRFRYTQIPATLGVEAQSVPML